MKFNIIIVVLLIAIGISSCEKEKFSNTELKTHKEYAELKNSVIKLQKDFQDKKVNEGTYAKKMENYGDIYVVSKVIPAERRYRMSIMCYKEALRYDKNNIELKKKLQKQKSLFKVAEH